MAVRLVGRDGQLATLDALRLGAPAGGDVVALLVGGAGIGKSAVAEAAARRAVDAGMPVVAGRAVADEGVPAFWPWLRVLDQVPPGVNDPLGRGNGLAEVAGQSGGRGDASPSDYPTGSARLRRTTVAAQTAAAAVIAVTGRAVDGR